MKKKIYYGWIIVAAMVINAAVCIGLFNSTYSIYVKPICADLGVTRAQYTISRTIISLVSALLLPTYGKLYRKMDIRKMMLAGSFVIGMTLIGYSFATRIWMFYVLAAVHGVFANCVSFVLMGTIINNWFSGNKALATSIAYCGSGLGAAFFIPFFTSLIQKHGWRFSYRVAAIAGIMAAALNILLLVRARPEDMGLEKLYIESKKQKKKRVQETEEIPYEQAIRMPQYRLIALAFVFSSISIQSFGGHLNSYISDIGYDASFASMVSSMSSTALTVGKLLLGWLYDTFGMVAGNMFFALFNVINPLMILSARFRPAAYLCGWTNGLANCGSTVAITVILTKTFGEEDFSRIYSLTSMITTLTSCMANPAAGMIYDITGSYTLAWIIILCFNIFMAGVVTFMTFRPVKKQEENA